MVSSSSLRQTTLRLLLGTSMPTAALLGMGASMRTPVVASLRAMSSARPVIRLIFTPALGSSSNRVTEGPRVTSMTLVLTPKSLRVPTSSLDSPCTSSSPAASLAALGSSSRDIGG